ncbi:hypothetical protein C6380_05195 [Pseudomonas syringae pv. actinidiae]|nr:hypothetical protein C6379_15950 [Pseudomonas syringae pv. actinidiae]RJX60207.1 hypothetical protein C6380_05195 [Pseudomonas syringae pv. actinidiae]RJX60331.1 hypothetical protein C6383_13790 [Pseudomonas syringae pv. actinidiae]RJY22772.1 hypothetical protein C6381_09030 [Pseudomonas syringae pv. actinidiae]
MSARLKAAQAIQWGVLVDAYLTNAAAVGEVYAASLYHDHSHRIEDGTTVVTPPVQTVRREHGFTLLRSLCGTDHYVLVTEFNGAT